MAKEEYEEVNIDDSFDFDDDLNLDMEDEMNPPPIRDDRNVIVKTSEKFAQSAMGEIVNPTNLSKLVRNALPKEMEAVRSLADDGLTTVREIYDETAEAVKGPIKATKKSLRAAKSVMGKVLPERLDKWLDGILAEDDDYDSVRETKEQQQENQIAQVLAENFKWQAAQEQENKAREEVQSVTEKELGRKTAEFSARTLAGIQRLNDYNDGPNIGYQRKMLEINYRQLFAQQGLLEETKFIRSEFIQELRSITKNTALPELVKQKKSEIMKDMSLRRLIDLGQKSINSMISDYFPNLGKNVRNFVMGKVGNFNDALGMLQQAADAYGMANDPSMKLGEQETIESDGHRLARGAAGMAGNMAGSTLMGWFGKKLRDLLGKNEWVNRKSMQLGRFTDNPEYYVNQMIQNGVSPDWLRKTFPGISDSIDDLVREVNPGLREKKDSVGFNKLSNLNEIAEFDNRTRLAITDIIPGYLARILQSSEGIRVGTLPPMKIFSHERQGFIDSKEQIVDLKARLFNDYDKERISRTTKEQRELMFGKDFEMSAEEEEAFNKAMLWRMRNVRGGDIKDLMSDDAFGDKVSKEMAERWRKRIQEEFGYDSETGKIDDKTENFERARKLNDEALSGSKGLPQLIALIKQQNEGGVQALEALKELGVVKEGINGSFDIDNEAYYKFLMENNHKENEEKSKQIKSGRSPTVSVGTIPTGAKRLPTRKAKGLLNGNTNSTARPHHRSDILSTLVDSRDALFDLRDHLLSHRENLTTNASMQTNYASLHLADQKHREEQTSRIVKAIEEQSQLLKIEFGSLGQSFKIALDSSFNALSNAMDKLMVAAGKINIDDAMLEKWERYKEATKSGYQKGTEWVGRKIASIGKGLEALPGKLKETGQRVFSTASDAATFTVRQLKKPVQEVFDLFSSEIREDLFVMKAGTLHKALTYANLVAGVYYDQVTGKTIEKFEKIRNPVMQRSPDGATVSEAVSEEDLKNGFYFANGEKVSMSRFKGLGLKIIGGIKDKLSEITNAFKPMQMLKRAKTIATKVFKTAVGFIIDDIYVGDETTPRITKQGVLNGEYTDASGNPLSPRHFESLSGDVYVKDPKAISGRRIILTLAEASEKGLFDSKHQPYKSLMGKIKSFLKKPWEIAKKVGHGVKEGVKNVLNGAFGLAKFFKRGLTLDMYPKFIYELLAWKYGAPEHHKEVLEGSGLPSKFFKRVKELFNLDKFRTAKEEALNKVNKAKEKILGAKETVKEFRKSLTVENVKEKGKALKENAKAFKERTKERIVETKDAITRRAEAMQQRVQKYVNSVTPSALKERYQKLKARVELFEMREFVKRAGNARGIKQLVATSRWFRDQAQVPLEERKKQLIEKKELIKKQLLEKRQSLKEALIAKKEAFKQRKAQAKEKLLNISESLKNKREELANRVGGWRHSLKHKAKKAKVGLIRRAKGAKEGISKLLLGAVTGIGLALTKLVGWAKSGFGIPKLLKGIWETGKFIFRGVTSVVGGLAKLSWSIMKLGGQLVAGLAKAGLWAGEKLVDGGKYLWENKGKVVEWGKRGIEGAKNLGRSALTKGLEWGSRALTYASRIPGAVQAGYSAFMATGSGAALAGAASTVAGWGAAAGSFLLTNPIGWAILGVAAGVAIWQFFKDDFEPLDRFRLLAYGLVPEDHKDHANRLLAFEKEVYEHVRFDQQGNPTVDEIVWEKWAGLFWSEDSGQPNQNNWPPHVEKFKSWFNNRFKPTFIQHVKNLRRLDNKIEPLKMDDDLDDALKPSWARSSFIENKEGGQGPYDFMFSPFSDIPSLDANYRQVENQRDIVVNKYASDEEKMKGRAENGRPLLKMLSPIGAIHDLLFEDNQEEAAEKLSRVETLEKFKDAKAELLSEKGKDGPKEELMAGALTKVTLTNADGTTKEVTLADAGYKIPESTNEFGFLNMFMLGMGEEIKKSDYELIREVEFKIHEELVKVGKGYQYKGDSVKLREKYSTAFGWSTELDGDIEAFSKWINNRIIPYVCAKKEIAIDVNKNVDFVRMEETLEFEELYKIAQRLSTHFYPLSGGRGGYTTFLKCPWRPFKNQDDQASDTVFAKWLESLKNRQGKNISKTLTDQEKEALKKKFKDGAQAELDRRDKLSKGINEQYLSDLEKQRAEMRKQGEPTYTTVSDTGYGQYQTQPAMGGNGGIVVDPTGGNILNVGSGGANYDATFQGSGDVRGITWQPRGEFLNPLQKGNPVDSVDRNYALVKDLISQVAAVAGVDAGLLAAMGRAESGFNANAGATTGTSAKGMYQFTNAAWTDMTKILKSKYSIENPQVFNPVHNTLGAAELIKQSITKLKPAADKAGVPVDATLLYASHFMGPSGVNNFLDGLATRPNTPITTSLSEEAARKNGALTSLGKSGPPYKNHIQLYNALREKMYGKDTVKYVEDARTAAGMSPKQVSDANYGQSQVNPSYQPNGTVPVGSGGSMASPRYDLRNMPDQSSVQVGGTQDYNRPIGIPQQSLEVVQQVNNIRTNTVQSYAQQPSMNGVGLLGGGQMNVGAPPQPPMVGASNPTADYRWMEIAAKEAGVSEVKGITHNPRILEYHATCGVKTATDELPWCSAFVNWVMTKAGFKGTNSAQAVSWAKWQGGQLFKDPCYGAIGVIHWGGGKGHVGFVIGKKGNKVAMLGGNQSDQVKVSAFPTEKFMGYVLPTGVNPIYDLQEYQGPMNVYSSSKDAMADTRSGPPQSGPDGNLPIALPNMQVPSDGGSYADMAASIQQAPGGMAGAFPPPMNPNGSASAPNLQDMSRASIVAKAPTSQQLMNGSTQGNVSSAVEVCSNVPSSEVTAPAVIPATPSVTTGFASVATSASVLEKTPHVKNESSPMMKETGMVPGTVPTTIPQQTSIQQAMNVPEVSSAMQTASQTAVSAQQQANMKVDRELVSELERLGQKQLDVLLSIDGKFDKLIEGVTGLGKVGGQTAPDTVGSSRTPTPVQTSLPMKEVSKGPLTTMRPSPRE